MCYYVHNTHRHYITVRSHRLAMSPLTQCHNSNTRSFSTKVKLPILPAICTKPYIKCLKCQTKEQNVPNIPDLACFSHIWSRDSCVFLIANALSSPIKFLWLRTIYIYIYIYYIYNIFGPLTKLKILRIYSQMEEGGTFL